MTQVIRRPALPAALPALAIAALALAAAGCQRNAPEEIPIEVPPGFGGYAPAVDMLPAGDPAPLGEPGPDDGYYWAEDAYALNHAFDDMPPDYAYGYDDIELWGWESEDGWYRLVEPLDGWDRYYYYRPGEDRPFYVVDNGFSYGFRNGVLVAVYDTDGRLMPRDYLASRADWAGRYLRRGRDLRAARAARRWQVAEARWERRQDRFAAEQARLARAAEAQAPWRAYRQRIKAERPAEFRRFETERARRQAVRAERRADRRAERREDRQDRREARREARDGVLTPQSAPPPIVVEDRRGPGKGRGEAMRSEKAEQAHARKAERRAAHQEAKREKHEEKARRKAEREAERN